MEAYVNFIVSGNTAYGHALAVAFDQRYASAVAGKRFWPTHDLKKGLTLLATPHNGATGYLFTSNGAGAAYRIVIPLAFSGLTEQQLPSARPTVRVKVPVTRLQTGSLLLSPFDILTAHVREPRRQGARSLNVPALLVPPKLAAAAASSRPADPLAVFTALMDDYGAAIARVNEIRTALGDQLELGEHGHLSSPALDRHRAAQVKS